MKNLTEEDAGGNGAVGLAHHTEFLWHALKETANLLMKAIAFYLAIAAAILGYVLSHPVPKSLRIVAALTVVMVTVLFTIAVGSVSWGLWTGVRDLQRAQEILSPDSFAQLRMGPLFYACPHCLLDYSRQHFLNCADFVDRDELFSTRMIQRTAGFSSLDSI